MSGKMQAGQNLLLFYKRQKEVVTCLTMHHKGPTSALVPPQRALLPLWLALLLKRQRRANVVPPPWLHPTSLTEILDLETNHFPDSFLPAPLIPPSTRLSTADGRPFYPSEPFLQSNTAEAASDALPYHWLEMGQILLDAAADDLVEPDKIRQLLRDLGEVRAAKMRKGTEELTGEANKLRLDGVGAMEVGESRGFITGVVDGLMRLGASREQARRDREAEERENRYSAEPEDDDMI